MLYGMNIKKYLIVIFVLIVSVDISAMYSRLKREGRLDVLPPIHALEARVKAKMQEEGQEALRYINRACDVAFLHHHILATLKNEVRLYRFYRPEFASFRPGFASLFNQVDISRILKARRELFDLFRHCARRFLVPRERERIDEILQPFRKYGFKETDVLNGYHQDTYEKKELLFYAIQRCCPATVAYLIRKGADCKRIGAGNATAMKALVYRSEDKCDNDFYTIADLLYENNAPMNIVDDWGSTALGLAAVLGNIDMIKWLLDHGADPNRQDSRREETPFMYFARYLYSHNRARHQEALRWFLDKDADENVTNYENKTIFDMLSTNQAQQLRKDIDACHVKKRAILFPICDQAMRVTRGDEAPDDCVHLILDYLCFDSMRKEQDKQSEEAKNVLKTVMRRA